MKKLLLLFSLATFTLASCSSDDNDDIIITPESIKGEYVGKMTINKEVEEGVNLKVDKNINFLSFPVKEIVSSIVPEDQLKATLEAIEAIPYSIEYTGEIVGEKMALLLAPKELSFDINAAEKTQKVVVTFDSKSTGIFDGRDNTLSFALKATKVSVDGEENTDFKEINYVLLPSRKTVVKLDVKDVEGTYETAMTAKQGEATAEHKLTSIAKDNVLTINEFPIKEIILAVVEGNTEKADAIIADLDKVNLSINYTAEVTKAKDAIELTLKPTDLKLKVKVEDVEKEVVTTFAADKNGKYLAKDKSLSFNLKAEKVSVDGKTIESFVAVEYDATATIKK